ncbi:MAG: WecB/TagA/CpsF family glycosyltransferase, partial [Oscillospiraceae bacterium]|nr:WecB/TagA/CpsF family glycosyltransferase [Oscillospiraceae bacterium]
EFLIHRHLQDFTKGVLMGVGGSFDVLSGMKRRAPALFVKTNTEWLYRILREPSRLKRFWRSNVKFLGEVRKAARK